MADSIDIYLGGNGNLFWQRQQAQCLEEGECCRVAKWVAWSCSNFGVDHPSNNSVKNPIWSSLMAAASKKV